MVRIHIRVSHWSDIFNYIFFIIIYLYMISLVCSGLIWRYPSCFGVILFVEVWSGDIQVALCICWCWNWLLNVVILFAKGSSRNISPFLFVSSCKVHLPVTLLFTRSFPNFPFRSPSVVAISLLGTSSTTDYKSS